MAAKVKNNAVEFWRIIFTLGVAYFHFNLMGMLINAQRVPGKDFFPIMTGGWVLGFFLYLTGYFMMAHYTRREDSIDRAHAFKPAWNYFWTRIKGLLPALFLGTLFVFVLRNVAVGTPIEAIPTLLIRSLFEFFGFYQLGVTGMNDVAGNNMLTELLAGESPSGIRAGMMSGGTPLWNGPGWYISAIIIVSVIIYWVLCKNKDFFLGVFCPLMIVGCYGYMGLAAGMNWNRGELSFLMLPTNLIRVTGGICIGCLMWFVVDWIKSKKIAETYKTAWNVLSVALTAFMLYTLWFGVQWSENQHNVFLIVFTVIVLVGDDAVSKALNNKFSAYCGKISLYWYVSHWGLVMLLPVVFPDMDYLVMCGVYFVLSFVVANVLMLIDTKLFKPMIAAASKGDCKRLVVAGVVAAVLLLGSYVAVQVTNPNFDFVNSEVRAAYEKKQAEQAVSDEGEQGQSSKSLSGSAAALAQAQKK